MVYTIAGWPWKACETSSRICRYNGDIVTVDTQLRKHLTGWGVERTERVTFIDMSIKCGSGLYDNTIW